MTVTTKREHILQYHVCYKLKELNLNIDLIVLFYVLNRYN
jgi:hypothetical protein